MLIRILSAEMGCIEVSLEIWNPDGTGTGRKQDAEEKVKLYVGDIIEVTSGGYHKIVRRGQDVKTQGIEPYKGLNERRDRLVKHVENLLFQNELFKETLRETLKKIRKQV